MVKNFILCFFVVLQLIAFSFNANAETELSSTEQKQLIAQLSQNLGLEVISVKRSAFAALIEVVTNQGMFYASADGKFLINGKLYGLADGNVVNYTEESLAQVLIDGMKQFENEMIIYQAKI